MRKKLEYFPLVFNRILAHNLSFIRREQNGHLFIAAYNMSRFAEMAKTIFMSQKGIKYVLHF